MKRHARHERLELILERLDQVEAEIFSMVESEPTLIRRAETLEAFQHLKAAAACLQILMKRPPAQAPDPLEEEMRGK